MLNDDKGYLSINETIPYYHAQQILEAKYKATADEICLWIFLEDLHIFEMEPNEAGQCLRIPPGYLVNLPCDIEPAKLLIQFRYYQREIADFDPAVTNADGNSDGRYWTYAQVIDRLAQRSKQEYAVHLIEREFFSGRFEVLHFVTGIIRPEWVRDGAMRLEQGLFPVTWVMALENQEFGQASPATKQKKRQRSHDLDVLVEKTFLALREKWGKDPSFPEIYARLEMFDEQEIIQDQSAEQVCWCDNITGKIFETTAKTMQNKLAKIRKLHPAK